MITALAWKDVREHRTIWLVMAAVGAGGLIAVTVLLGSGFGVDRPGVREQVIIVAALLAWAYGMVCGAMLLAGEREDGTLSFLDALPSSRQGLWVTKCTAGLGLVLGQAVILLATLIALKVPESAAQVFGSALAVGIAGMVGLGWGLLFSAGGSSVLRVIGQAVGAQVLTGFGLLVLVILAQLSLGPGSVAGDQAPILFIGFGVLGLTALAFVGSRRIFSQLDIERTAVPTTQGRARQLGHSLRVLFWLCWRQARGFTFTTALVCLVLGWLVLLGGASLWPLLTLVVGVLCGATVFADEQALGSNRFLGDQRFPPGRVWSIKTAVRFAVLCLAVLLLLLPSMLRGVVQSAVQNHQDGPPIFLVALFPHDLVSFVATPAPFLTMWALYGFAAGQLCGLLVRKPLVACVLGLGLSLVGVSIWLPSLVGGGLLLWQIAGVPVLALVASRLIYPAWAGGRLASWSTVIRLGAVAAGAVVFTVGAVAWRVLEVPPPRNAPTVAEAIAGMPPADDPAGRLIRQASEMLTARAREVPGEPPRPQPRPRRGTEAQDQPFQSQAVEAITKGWPKGNAGLDQWMDQVVASTWPADLARAAELPLGLVEDPRRLTVDSAMPALHPARQAGTLLLAHGLRRQAAGDDAAFVADLRVSLAVARNLRNHGIIIAVHISQGLENDCKQALDRWLERLSGRPDLLRQALDALLAHEAQAAHLGDGTLSEYLLWHNTLDNPITLLANLPFRGRPTGTDLQWAAAVSLAYQVPWEHERNERLIGWAFSPNPRPVQAVLARAPWHELISLTHSHAEARALRDATTLHACELAVALRLYQVEKGVPAPSLAALVPGCVKKLPADPYDPAGGPLHYRLSAGEEVALPGQERRIVPAGWGIIWSFGPDGQDDGGRGQRSSDFRDTRPGSDLIFLVPPPQ